jgi:hypothetical protein
VESHQLAKELIDYMDADILPCNSYRVMLDAQGRLEWITEIDGKQVTYHRDPESGLWSRFLVRLMQMLPIEDQL